MQRYSVLSIIFLAGSFCVRIPNTCAEVCIPESAHNSLVDAKISSNLESYSKGLRGEVDHMIYDLRRQCFVKSSQWHEYGVGFGSDLGVVAEDEPVWWLAEWPQDCEANMIVLSGTYDNQAQPNTGWKIELRHNGRWKTHARGVGGWYDRGRYVWGGPGTEAITFGALRVSTFSKDKQTSIKSIHFRGETGVSWVVAYCPPIDARVMWATMPIRAGETTAFKAMRVLGDITSWQWNFGDGTTRTGPEVSHTFARPGSYDVGLVFSDDKDSGQLTRTVVVDPPVEARIQPLDAAVKVGCGVEFAGNDSVGDIVGYTWDFGDGNTGSGERVRHTFTKAGIYRVVLSVSDGTYSDECPALIRVHTDETLNIPQVLLDTDQKNEQDDQHYLGYGLFSELDILGVNSVHHGGGQELENYAEIQIDQSAMKEDIFNTMKGEKQKLEKRVPTGVTFHKDTLYRPDGHGDNWRPAWAADDSQIIPMCDGSWLGIKGYHNHLYRIIGGPDSFLREDIPHYPDFSGKPGSWFGYGVVSVDGILYSVVSKTPGTSWSGPFRGIKLLKSKDNGDTWYRVDRHGNERKLGPQDNARNEVNSREMFFLEEFGLPHQIQKAYPFSFVDFVKCGKDNSAARDNFLYIYSPEGAHAHKLLLARVPKDKLGFRNAWEYFVKYQDSQPVWTSDIRKRGYAHIYPEKSRDGNCFGWYSWVPSVVWNEGLGLYIMVNGGTYGGSNMTSSDKDYYSSWMHTQTGSLGFWYSKNPYGPWHQFYCTEYWTVDDSKNRTYQPSLSPKWISTDGKEMVLIWSDAMKNEEGRSHTVNYKWNHMKITIKTK